MPKKTASKARKPARDAFRDRARPEEAFGTPAHELRRDGRAPLVFAGRKLAEVTSYAPGTSLWYEIAAYGGEKGYAAAIKVFKKDGNEPDIHVAKRFSDLEGIMSYLEDYDAARDVTVPYGMTDTRLPPAMAAVHAAALRQRIAEAEMEFGAAAGEVLTELMQHGQGRRGAQGEAGAASFPD